MLRVYLLTPSAKIPTVAHSGEDIGFDLYADETTTLYPHTVTKVKTGIAIEMDGKGGLIRDRSSMAAKAILAVGGVIDAGYRDEVQVMLFNGTLVPIYIMKGDKIAQLIAGFNPVNEDDVEMVETLPGSIRDKKGFGSSGIR